MLIPLLDLKKEYSFFKKEISRNIQGCFKSQHWILGKEVSDFENKTSAYLGAKYSVGVSSGTEALILSLSALALRMRGREYFDKKDEVITTPFTFIATAESIVRSGATPVFVDIDPDTYNIDPLKIKKAITKNTVGILPVHLYGLAADLANILKIARENNLFVVEDAAQAFGSSFQNKKLGSFGDCGAFSFFPSKNLGAFGDGGMIVTNNYKLAEFLKLLRNHGQCSQYDASCIGYNSRLDSIQAAVLLAKLKYIDKMNALRRRVAEKYNTAFRAIKEIKIPFVPEGYKHIYHLYSLKVSSKRGEFLNYLNSKGISSRIYYPLPLHRMKAFRQVKLSGSLKVSEDTAKRILSLPVYPFLGDRQVEYTIAAVKRFYEKRKYLSGTRRQ